MAKKSKNKIEKKEEKSSNKELYWVFGLMAVLILVFVVSYDIFSSYRQFEYEGLTFTREKFGKIPVYRYSYFFENDGRDYKYNLYLRNDPRQITVPLTGKIVYKEGKFTYLSINNTGLAECPNSPIAVAGLSNFLSGNFLTIKVGTPDEDEAEEKSIRHATCETIPDRVVILIQKGNETKIEKEGESCHIINVANCEILEALEKFEVQSIIDAKG